MSFTQTTRRNRDPKRSSRANKKRFEISDLSAVILLQVLAPCAFAAFAIYFPFLLVPLFAYIVVLISPSILFINGNEIHPSAKIVLDYLDQAVRLNLPLDWMLASAADSEPQKERDRLLALRQALAEGRGLGVALIKTVPELGIRRCRLIEAAENMGQLGPVLSSLHEPQGGQAHNQQTFLYPVCVLLSLCAVFLFIVVFVLPQYEQIYARAGAPVPDQIRYITHFIERYTTLLMLGFGLVLYLIWLCLCWALLSSRGLKPGPLHRCKDALIWRIPLIGPMVRDRGLAEVLPLLARATASGMPLESALGETLSLRVNAVLLKKLQHWQTLLAGGVPLAEATRQARLPLLMVEMLGPASKTSGFSTALDYLARYYALRFSRTLAFFEGAVGPALILLMGLGVAWVAVLLISPISDLLNFAAQTPGLM